MNRIATLDVLRFLAAISVVFYHYIARTEATAFQSIEAFVQYGYLGVPIFFMISGYVISLSAENRSAYQFAVSRFVRLYPALWFGVLFTTLVLFLFEGAPMDLKKVLVNMTLLNDYFGIDNVDGVYWTLQAELKFYGCVFLLVALGVFQYYKVWLSIWLMLTVTHLLFLQPSIMGWFISPGYSPFFIAGVTFYLLQKRGFDSFNTLLLLFSAILCAYQAHAQAPEFIRGISDQERFVASLIVLGSMVLFMLIARGNVQFKGSSFTYTLGALTYPLYLLHNSAGKALIDSELSHLVGEAVAVVLVTILMIVLSFIVFRQVEKPLSSLLRTLLIPKRGS